MFENKFDKYIILKRKINKKIIIWTISTLLIFLFFIMFIGFYKMNNYLEYEAQVSIQNDVQIIFYAKDSDLNKLKNKKLYINGKKIDYNILEFSKDYYIASDGKNYKQVIMKCEIDEHLKVNNNIINLKFKVGKTTIMDYIIKHFRGS